MKIYKYTDYDHYVEAQTKANIRKLHWVYVQKKTISTISDMMPNAKAILCHGTRNGTEQKMFKERFPDAFIMGSEISETATQFPMTTQWDFAKENPDWLNKFDIVYSNSFDHSIDPRKTLTTWRDQLSKTGKMFLEYSEAQSVCDPTDPFDATLPEVKGLIEETEGLELIDEIRGTAKRKGDVVLVLKLK